MTASAYEETSKDEQVCSDWLRISCFWHSGTNPATSCDHNDRKITIHQTKCETFGIRSSAAKLSQVRFRGNFSKSWKELTQRRETSVQHQTHTAQVSNPQIRLPESSAERVLFDVLIFRGLENDPNRYECIKTPNYRLGFVASVGNLRRSDVNFRVMFFSTDCATSRPFQSQWAS